eukprot:TRINITY_DN2173_c0_g2_i2.p2 TRINITY_DN2173_c0_g2~~TRINITY_DN2173_c0_g2_i2.p2  ORF type:complete len:126 (-),score=5.29 TRINITY_DN2173_c0_g2_i2:51-428(-)
MQCLCTSYRLQADVSVKFYKSKRTPKFFRDVGIAGCLSLAMTATCLPCWGQEYNIQQKFSISCAGCHYGGGNVVQSGATLFVRDLERNGYLDVDKLYEIIYYGKGKMPGFGQECTPRVCVHFNYK